MAEGTAKIKAQANFDINELRRVAAGQAKEQRDFPKQAASIIAAAEQQAREVRAEANRKSLDMTRKASDAAAVAEREANQARVSAMADGVSKIRAQAAIEVAEIQRAHQEQADQYKLFPKVQARIIAAGRSEVLGVQAEANRRVAEFEKEEAKKREADAKRREAALRKAQQDVGRQASLQRQVSNLNTNVGAKVDSGTLTSSGLASFTQQLENLKARIKELPVPLQATFAGLLKQSDALVVSGKKAAEYNAELKNLKGSLKDMGYDELLAAQKRVADDPGKQKSLALIDAEIAKRQKLIKTHADQVLIEGRAQYKAAQGQATISGYEDTKSAVQGKENEAQLLLAIERKYGVDVLRARQQVAQASAETDIAQINQTYSKEVGLAKGNSAKIAELTALRDNLITQRRAQRDAEQQRNLKQSNAALISASNAAAAELLKIDGQRAAGKAAITAAEGKSILDEYARRQDAAHGNAEALLKIEQEMGGKVKEARRQEVQESARTDVQGIKEMYLGFITAAGTNKAEVARLAAERDTLIEARRKQRNTAFKLLDQQAGQSEVEASQKAAQQIAEIDSQREAGHNAVLSGRAQATLDAYGREQDAAQQNIVKLLQIEQQSGAQVLAARIQQGRAQADADVRQLKSSYQTQIDQAILFGQSYAALEQERDKLILQRQGQQATAELLLAQQSGQALIDARKKVTDALLALDQSLASGLAERASTEAGRKKDQFERDLANDLSDLGDNERAKYDLLRRSQTTRIALAQRAVTAQEQVERLAENQRFENEKDRLTQAGLYGSRRIQLEADHQARLTLISTKGIQGRANVEEDLVRAGAAQLSKVNETEVKKQIDAVTRNLSSMTALQRDSARSSLMGWLDTFQKAGVAGQAAVKLIQDALLGVANADTDARAKAVELAGKLFSRDDQGRLQSPDAVRTQVADRTNSIGKPDGQRAAITKATASYNGDIETLKQEIADAKKVIAELGKLPPERLDALERQALDYAQQLLPIFEAQLPVTQKKAADAGQAAGAAYIKALSEAVVSDPLKATADLKRKLGRIGKAETADDARDTAVGQFDSLKKVYDDAIKDLNDKLDGLNRPDLTPNEKTQKEGLEGTRTLFQGFLKLIGDDAQAAGNKAFNGFTQTAADKAAEGTLALASAARELAIANAETLPTDQQPAALAAVSATYQAALTVYRDYWNERLKLAQAGKAAGTVTEAELTEVSTKAAAAQKTLTGEIVTQGNTLDASNKKTTEGITAVRQAREAYDAVLGLSAPAYQSEIDALQKLKQENGDLAGQIDTLIGKYKTLQNARKGITAMGISTDFQAGRNGGQEQLQGSVTSIAKGLGALTSPLSILSAILDKINPAGEILAGMFSVLEEPIKALQEPFQQIGVLLGSVIAPVLELIAPVLNVIAQLFTALYDAIASFIKAITFGFVNIDRRDPKAKGTADQKNQGDQTQLDLDYRKGLTSRQDYETQKLKLLKDGLDAQQSADLKAAGSNLAQRQQIERKYAQQYEKERLDMLDRLYEADLANLDEQLKTKEISEKKYAQKKYDLTHGKLVRERDDALALAGDSAEKRLQIEKNYLKKEGQARQEMLAAVYAAYIKIADDLGSALTSGISTSLLGAAQARNFGQFRTEFRKNLRESIFQAVLSAAIESAAFGALLQPAIDALKAAFMTDGTADDDAAIQGLLKASDAVEGKAKQIYKALQPLRDRLGIGTDSSQPQQIEVVGNISTPEVKVSLDMLSYLADVIKQNIPTWRDAIVAHTPALNAETAALLLHVPALSAHTLAMPTFVSAVTSFGLHTTSLSGTAMLYSTTTDRFVQGVNLWANASAAHIGAMNAHTAALQGSGSSGGTRKYQGG